MLTPLQRRLVQLVADLPEAGDFALAGGAALISRGLVHRVTRDLDFFATSADAVTELVPALEARLKAAGLRVARIRDVPGFVRLEITSPDGETVEVDLSHDARQHGAEITEVGLTLAKDELAADKMLALFGRAEARDFVDVAALLEVYSSEQLIELAREKDAGFSLDRFRESLAAIHRLDATELETTGANSGEIVALFDTWQERLTVVDGDE